MQLIGIISLFLVGLCGSEYILSKKRALTTFRLRQRGGLCQMRGSMEGWKDSTQEGLLIVRIFIFDNSYNYPGSCHRNKYYINGHGFHNFASFLVIGFAFRWINVMSKRGEGNRKNA